MPDFDPDANPYATPRVVEDLIEERLVDRDQRLRHEYLGALLLAAAIGLLAVLMLLVSRRQPTSGVGEIAIFVSRFVAFSLATVSLMFVAITLRAAIARVLLLLGRIRRGRR